MYHWSGKLATDSTVTITLGNGTIKWDSINYFLAYSQLPNGHSDSDERNDTLRTEVVPPSLNGTYTVGSTTADFKSFEDAVEITMLRGICGPVVF
ncbi:MAG TPA: hypothetical protein VLB84_10120 [Bacteroidia bacterium]|nr:hypothetical protein [Bacteroidia bacterium]